MAGSKAFDFLCTFTRYPSEASMKFGRNSTTEKSDDIAAEFFLKLRSELFNLSKRLVPFERREAAVNGRRDEREKRDSHAESGKRFALDKKGVGLTHTSLKPTKSMMA